MNFFKKYTNEFMRASKFAGYFALGMLIATGVVPAIFCETAAEAIDQLVGSVYGILTSYCGVVLLLWAAEIVRTKRLAKIKAEKKAARMAAKKAKAEAEAAQAAEAAEEK
ncbi:MAG: hypothetical protein IKU27_04975 [Clostridia bacterium]|nr:hypothetical protein [Clostridia bacterium]